MYISIFSDELFMDIYEALPILKSWGMTHVDFRGRINGKAIEKQTDEELYALKAALDSYGLKPGVIQSSLCKVHLPDAQRQAQEMEKLEGIIRASNILGTKLVRSFFYWQHSLDDPACGELAMRPDALAEVMDMYAPIAKRAKEAGLILGFENCGVTPDEVICVLEALNEPQWGLAWDVSNMFELLPEAKGDCVAYFTKALKYANMVHVKSRGVETLPMLKYKKVPWARVLAGVAVTGKDMPVSVETHVPVESTLDKVETSRHVYEYVKKNLPAFVPADMKAALSPRLSFERTYAEDPVKVVVVGLGEGQNRCDEIVQTSGIRLYGVCDIDGEKAKGVGEKHNVPYSTDMQVFLQDPQVEVMYIMTPTGTHCQLAMQCFDSGKHVLVASPVDASAQKCEQAISMAKEKGLLFGVDAAPYASQGLCELKLAVEDGFFGDGIVNAGITVNVHKDQRDYEENSGWRGEWIQAGGGALSDPGADAVDWLIAVLGAPDEVRAVIATQTHDIEVEDYGCAQWRYANGAVVRLAATTSYPALQPYVRVEVYGDRGAYLNASGGPEGDQIHWYSDGKWSQETPFPCKQKWQNVCDQFAYCLRMGAPLEATAEKGRLTRRILDSMYESARHDGVWTPVKK